MFSPVAFFRLKIFLLLIDFPVFVLADDGPEDADSAFSGFCFLALQDDHVRTNTVCCLGFV